MLSYMPFTTQIFPYTFYHYYTGLKLAFPPQSRIKSELFMTYSKVSIFVVYCPIKEQVIFLNGEVMLYLHKRVI